MTITANRAARHRGEQPGASSARRGILVAASTGIVISIATTASAVPVADTAGPGALTGQPEVGRSTIPEAALEALATAPAVAVDADATWEVDDFAAGVGVNGSPAEAAVVETSRDLDREAADAAEPAAIQVAPLNERGHVTTAVNLRSGPGVDNTRVTTVAPYTTFDITGKAAGWYRINYNGSEGWVSVTYARVGEAPAAPAPAAEEAAPAEQAPVAPEGSSAFGASVVSIARQYIGTPYVYGGKAPGGFDCSGFTSYVFGQMGISIPSSSSGQYGVGRQVAAAEAMPGDLIWWPGHVGIYTGNGMHIAARNPGNSLAETKIHRSGGIFFRLGG